MASDAGNKVTLPLPLPLTSPSNPSSSVSVPFLSFPLLVSPYNYHTSLPEFHSVTAIVFSDVTVKAEERKVKLKTVGSWKVFAHIHIHIFYSPWRDEYKENGLCFRLISSSWIHSVDHDCLKTSKITDAKHNRTAKQSKIIGRIGFSSCSLVHALVLCVAVREQKCRHQPPPRPSVLMIVTESSNLFLLLPWSYIFTCCQSIFTLSIPLSLCQSAMQLFHIRLLISNPYLPPIHYYLLLFSFLSLLLLLRSMILTSPCISYSASNNTDPSSSPPPCPALPSLATDWHNFPLHHAYALTSVRTLT